MFLNNINFNVLSLGLRFKIDVGFIVNIAIFHHKQCNFLSYLV